MRKLIPFLVSGILIVGVGACGKQDQAGTQNPGTTNEATAPAPAQEAAQTSPEVATTPGVGTAPEVSTTPASEVPSATGAPSETTTAATDLPAKITSKLVEKLPNSILAVEAKYGAVTVTGTVPSADQKKQIEPLVKQVKGVKTVKVDVKVEPAKTPGN